MPELYQNLFDCRVNIYKGFKEKVEESRGEMEKEEEGGKKKVDGNWAIRIFLD
ncbi:hypothetical protein [Thauera humireducens]|uniref:hypothetical protein n=1 Tax=Thauera humireducens TaxID=1134435 RepID=UPI0024A95C89|nr:hypothetical protein [Thauera humireducens]